MVQSYRLHLVILALTVAALLLQSAGLEHLAVFGVKPDLMIVLPVCLGLRLGPKAGALQGFVGGVLLGLVQGVSVASFAVSRAFAGALAGWLQTRLSRDNQLVPLICVALGTIGAECVFFLMSPIFHVFDWARITLLETAYNVVVTPLVYGGVVALAKFLEHRFSEAVV